jgi:hypothetical protein
MGDPHQISPKAFCHPLDFGGRFRRRANVGLRRRDITVEGKLIGKALAAVLILLEFSENIADMPGGVA